MEKLKIYFIHSLKNSYNESIYLPVSRNDYLSNHNLVFAQSENNKGKYYKDLIGSSDILVIDLTDADVSLNMEVKEAIIVKKPLLVLANKKKGYESKYQKFFTNIIGYESEEEFALEVEKFARSYEGKIVAGHVDPTITLGILN